MGHAIFVADHDYRVVDGEEAIPLEDLGAETSSERSASGSCGRLWHNELAAAVLTISSIHCYHVETTIASNSFAERSTRKPQCCSSRPPYDGPLKT